MSKNILIGAFLAMAIVISFVLVPSRSQANDPAITPSSPTSCTLGSCPLTLSSKDNGKKFIYSLNERITVVLNDAKEPRQELFCTPSNILTPLAIAPPATYPFYAQEFQIQKRGTCVLHSGDFSVNITASRFR